MASSTSALLDTLLRSLIYDKEVRTSPAFHAKTDARMLGRRDGLDGGRRGEFEPAVRKAGLQVAPGWPGNRIGRDSQNWGLKRVHPRHRHHRNKRDLQVLYFSSFSCASALLNLTPLRGNRRNRRKRSQCCCRKACERRENPELREYSPPQT